MTIAAALEAFFKNRAVYVSPATIVKYKQDLKLFINFLDGLTVFPDTRNIYQDYILHLRAQGIRSVTIRSYCRSVKTFLRWCYEEELCPDYLKRVQLPKDDSLPKLPLFADEVSRLDAVLDLNTLLGRRNYCIVHLMLDCGLRAQEVIHLQFNHIFPDKNIIQILDSKGNKSRMTLVPDFLLDALALYSSMAGISSGFLLRNVDGKPLTGNTLKQLFQNLKHSAAIPRIHAHLLRHTFATSYLIGGGNMEFLRVFLGHSDYAVTQNYSRMAAEYKMLGADIYRLDSIFFERGY